MSDRNSTLIPSELRDAVAAARDRAILARYVAEAFSAPNKAWHARLSSKQTLEELCQALHCIAAPCDHNPARTLCTSSVEELQDEHARLTGHTVRSACPPYELEYAARNEIFQQSQQLADIAGFYAAFGYQAAGPLAERPDHVVAEWEFVAVLAIKQALALEAVETEAAECFSGALRAFLTDHVGQWFPAFLSRLGREELSPFYAGLVDFGGAVLRHLCATFDVPVGPGWLELRPIEDDDSSMNCGGEIVSPEVELGPTLAAAMRG